MWNFLSEASNIYLLFPPMLLNGWKGFDFSLLLKMTSGFSRISRVFSAFGSKPIFAAFLSWPLQKQPLWRHILKTCAHTESKLLRILSKRALIPVSTDLLCESWTFGPIAQSRIKNSVWWSPAVTEREISGSTYLFLRQTTPIFEDDKDSGTFRKLKKLTQATQTIQGYFNYFKLLLLLRIWGLNSAFFAS